MCDFSSQANVEKSFQYCFNVSTHQTSAGEIGTLVGPVDERPSALDHVDMLTPVENVVHIAGIGELVNVN